MPQARPAPSPKGSANTAPARWHSHQAEFRAHLTPGTPVEASDEGQFLLERRDGEGGLPDGETCREDGFSRWGMETLAGVQLTHLVPGEVDGVEATVRALSTGEFGGDIAHRIEMNVMQHNRDIVPSQHDILFQKVCPDSMCVSFRCECMLRQIARSTAMGNHNRLGRGHERWHGVFDEDRCNRME